MKTYELDKLNEISIFGTEGSGHQTKIWIDNKSRLIKLNSKYKEASKEQSASTIALLSNLNAVKYQQIEVIFKGTKRIACICNNYLQSNVEESFTLYDLISLVQVGRNTPTIEFFNNTVNEIVRQTELDRSLIIEYLMQILVLDYLILNEDRHLSNIEFIRNSVTNQWRLAPIFDCGKSFLCRDGIKSNLEMISLIRKYKSKPFSTNPEKNLININYAKEICFKMIKNIERNGGLDRNIDIKEFHKRLFKYRVKQLLGL